MLLQDQLTKYVNAMLSYDTDAKDLREAKKDFKASFVKETGAGKDELKFLDKAISIGKKLETNYEYNDYTSFVEKVFNMLNSIAPGNEGSDDAECPVPTVDTQMSISFNGGPVIETSTSDMRHALAAVKASRGCLLEGDAKPVFPDFPDVETQMKSQVANESSIVEKVQRTLLEKDENPWNPPPAPIIPQGKGKK